MKLVSYEFAGFAIQGWQCPVCRRVYSPSNQMCWYCGNEQYTTSTSVELHMPNNDPAENAEEQELIRCKDCQFYNEGSNEVDSWMRCRLHSINAGPDEFCSWAVKKVRKS